MGWVAGVGDLSSSENLLRRGPVMLKAEAVQAETVRGRGCYEAATAAMNITIAYGWAGATFGEVGLPRNLTSYY